MCLVLFAQSAQNNYCCCRDLSNSQKKHETVGVKWSECLTEAANETLVTMVSGCGGTDAFLTSNSRNISSNLKHSWSLVVHLAFWKLKCNNNNVLFKIFQLKFKYKFLHQPCSLVTGHLPSPKQKKVLRSNFN